MTRVVQRTIPITGTTSDELLVDDSTPVALVLPAALDGATLYLQGSWDNGVTWGRIMESDGSPVTIAFTANAIVKQYVSDQLCPMLRIVTTAAQNTAARTFRWIVRDLGG